MAKTTKSSPAKKGRVLQWDGKVITEPGIYRGIALDIYHSAELFAGVPAISSSGLRTIFNRSAAHYYAESPYNPNRIESEDKKHFALGRAVHHLILGEPHFAQLFVIQPVEMFDPKTGEVKPWHSNRTVCRQWTEHQRDLGKTILTAEDVAQIKGMALSIGRHPLVQQGVLNGEIENSYFWRDKETGIWLKWRPDSTPTHSADFVDLKTTLDVLWFKLQRTIEDYGYHQQGALGRAACRELLGREMDSFSLFFVEKKNPWCCRLVQLKDSDLALGERMNRSALRTFWKCLKDQQWPGPAENDVEHIEINERSQTRIKEILQAQGV